MLPTIVVAAVVVALLVVALIVVRSKNKAAEAEAPRFEPPRELAPQKPKEPAASTAPPVAVSTAPTPPATSQPPASGQFPAPAAAQEQTAALGAPPVAPPPPAPTPLPVAAEPPKPPPPAEEPKQEQTEALVSPPVKTPPPTPAPTPKPSAPPVPGAPAKPRAPLRSYSSINDLDGDDKAEAKAASPKPTAPPPMPARTSEAKVAAAPPKPAAIPSAPPKSEPKVATGKMPPAKPEEHDFSALAEAKPEPKPEPKVEAKPEPKPEPKVEPAKPTGAGAAAAIAAKYMQPSNPATAELEKNDPRHAAARKFARLSVSEIKLYHEDEVKAGRENKDLWTRLQTDIGLARQTFEQRVVAEVRERFDYLLDEIIRQLAEGDASKLGPDAPQLKTESGGTAGVPAATEPKAASAAPSTPKPVPEAPKSEPKAEPKPAAAAAAPVVARAGAPANPETAELEKSDPRHAAARRLARLSVSEIKLYHEAEVTAGRENKDLWSRLTADIALATTTFEKRVDKEVRDRFDYLYDEILRQLAEGDVAKLGPGAPTPKKVEAPAPAPTPTPAAPAAAAAAPAPTPAAPAALSGAAAGIAAKYMQPGNPATAELEKSDPRHAAARRFARLSVSEIKLYHEDEVKAGREAKDLWTRMSTDIGLAMQTYEKRVDKEVRDRFDYLYDEILRQLAEGDAAKLGPGAPAPKP